MQRTSAIILWVCAGLTSACADEPVPAGDTTGAGAETDVGGSDADSSGTDSEQPMAEGSPPGASLKKLRSWEYRNSIEGLLGADVAIDRPLPEDFVRANFTSIAAAQDCYEELAVEELEVIARDVAASAFASDPTPLSATGCAPNSVDDPCVREFVAELGLNAWRRPLTDAELDKYVGLLGSLTSLYDGSIARGAELTVAAMVTSPYFLYRVELGEATGNGALRKYSAHEMASRLAFTLWEQAPDETLLAAAAAGELSTAESVREHAERMLVDDRAIWPLFRFWREHLGIDRLTLTNYPRANASELLYDGLREEGRFLAYNLSLPGADSLSFLDAPTAFLQPGVAQLYGLSVDQEKEVELPSERLGFLTSGLFLLSNSHPQKTSPTRRGKFVLDRVLCRPIPAPPANVDLELPEPLEGQQTGRDVLDRHSSDPSCAGCHVQLDPPGFAFESFGPMGVFRDQDNGLAVDSTGEFDGESFSNAREFVGLLRKSPSTPNCLSTQLFRSTMGVVEGAGQAPYLTVLEDAFETNAYDLRAQLVELVASDAFRFATGFSGGE